MKTNKYKFQHRFYTNLKSLIDYAHKTGCDRNISFLASLNLTEKRIGIPCRYSTGYLESLITEDMKIEIENI
jgi:hypothetical protein